MQQAESSALCHTQKRFIEATQHPAWAGRLDPHADGAGLTFFRNALRVIGKDLG